MEAVCEKVGADSDISPSVHGSRADPPARSQDASISSSNWLGLSRCSKTQSAITMSIVPEDKGKASPGPTTYRSSRCGSIVNPIVHIYANHLGDLTLEILNCLGISNIRIIKLTTSAGSIIQQGHTGFQKSVDPRIELDRTVIAREMSCYEFRAHSH